MVRSFCLVAALVMVVAGLAVASEHKDAGVGLIIAAATLAFLTLEPVRRTAWDTVSKKPSKGRLVLLVFIAVFVASLVKFGPATTFEHIGYGIQNVYEWLEKVIKGSKDGAKA